MMKRKYTYGWKRTHRCQYCGKPFEAKRTDAKYCPGGACRVAAHRISKSPVTKTLPGVTDIVTIHKKAGKAGNLVNSVMLDLQRIRLQLKTADQDQADAINHLLNGLKAEINDLLRLRDKEAQSRLEMFNQYTARRTK